MKIILPVFALVAGKNEGNISALKEYIKWAHDEGYNCISELPFNKIKSGCTSPFSCTPFGLNTDYLSKEYNPTEEELNKFKLENKWLDSTFDLKEQYLIHLEQLEVKELCHSLGMKREVSMSFGVDAGASDFVVNNPEIFDTNLELGTACGQRWGLPAFKINDAYYTFLRKRFTYLKQYVDIVFLDHMCGYISQFVYGNKGNRYYDVPEWDIVKRKNRLKKVIDIIIECGLEVRGETLGDWGRQSICEEVLNEYNIPRMWVATQQDWIPDNVEVYLTTHDTPTLRQIFKGYRLGHCLYDFPRYRVGNLLYKLIPNYGWWESLEKGLTESEITSIIESVKNMGGVIGIWDYVEGDYHINIAGTPCDGSNTNFNIKLPDIRRYV